MRKVSMTARDELVMELYTILPIAPYFAIHPFFLLSLRRPDSV